MLKYIIFSMISFLLGIFVLLCIISTSFIWKIEVIGNSYISTEEVIKALEDTGVYIGKSKLGLQTKKIVTNLRVLLPDAAWIGVDIEGTNIYVNIVEKTRLPDSAVNENSIGDIVSDKSGIIEKIIAENGTPILSAGEYVEEGRILIEGKIYSDLLETKDVSAKGLIVLKTEYEYEGDYNYIVQEKEYTGKTKYSIGISINNKENYINYLDKSLKYDIIKNSSDISFFGNTLSFDIYKFNIYNLVDRLRSRDEIFQVAQSDAENYINNEVLPKTRNGKIINSNLIIDYEDNEKISVRIVYELTEEVGYFRERN